MSQVLELREIQKSFGLFSVLKGVSLEVGRGEILGVVGPNGAGKSTLLKIATGQIAEDAGVCKISGVRSDLRQRNLNVAIVPQELSITSGLTIEQNINLPSPPSRIGILRKGAALSAASSALDRLGVPLDVRRDIETATPAEQRMVMIARAIQRAKDVLIVDEPTAALANEDRERVLQSLERLRDAGMAIIFVSHRFDEVERLCSRVLLLRDGQNVGELVGEDVKVSRLVEFVAEGTETSSRQVNRTDSGDSEVLISMRGISSGPLADINLDIRKGELLAIAGLVGSGVSALTAILSGCRLPDHGEMRLGGQRYAPKSPHDALRAGVTVLPQERAHAGFPEMPVRTNAAMATLNKASKGGFISTRMERNYVLPVLKKLGLETRAESPLVTLSGGNRQRALLSRCILIKPKLIVLEDPTVGVDVLARRSIHALLTELAENGTTVVFSSSDDLEIVDLATRVIVVANGRITRTLEGSIEDGLSLQGVSEAITTGHIPVVHGE